MITRYLTLEDANEDSFIKKNPQKICTLKKNFIPLQPKILVTTQLNN